MTLRELRKFPLMQVCWEDIASHHTGWFDEKDAGKTSTVMQVGWLLPHPNQPGKKLMIAAGAWIEGCDLDDEISMGSDTVMPESVIIWTRVLRKRWWQPPIDFCQDSAHD